MEDSIKIMVLVAGCLVLQGCVTNMDSPSVVTPHRVQLEEERYSESYDVASLNGMTLQEIGRRYDHHGGGALDLNVTYDPYSKSGNTAMRANDAATRIAASLRKLGVRDVQVGILPVLDSGASRALVSYSSYHALAPRDCGMMPGFDGARVAHDPDYKIGCSIETVFAMQIARPKDLAGQGGLDRGDGRRAANVAETYRSGVPNAALGGDNASGE